MRSTTTTVSAWHLAWSAPAGLAVGAVAFVTAFFAWCGTERCAAEDPARYAVETTVAFVVTGVGALLGGVVVRLAPWTRQRGPRAAVTVVVVVLPLVAAVAYVARFGG